MKITKKDQLKFLEKLCDSMCGENFEVVQFVMRRVLSIPFESLVELRRHYRLILTREGRGKDLDDEIS